MTIAVVGAATPLGELVVAELERRTVPVRHHLEPVVTGRI